MTGGVESRRFAFDFVESYFWLKGDIIIKNGVSNRLGGFGAPFLDFFGIGKIDIKLKYVIYLYLIQSSEQH